ncbi:MAG: hypothetical protein QN178_17760 [Armatimonadota bacterium]|nr:hypothetical protein [Armatimonadota bacterium]
MPKGEVPITPEVLTWAVRQSGYDERVVAERVKVSVEDVEALGACFSPVMAVRRLQVDAHRLHAPTAHLREQAQRTLAERLAGKDEPPQQPLLYNDAPSSGCARRWPSGGGRPDERLRMSVVMRHGVSNGADEVGHAAKGPAANPLPRDLGKPAFHEVVQFRKGVDQHHCETVHPLHFDAQRVQVVQAADRRLPLSQPLMAAIATPKVLPKSNWLAG